MASVGSSQPNVSTSDEWMRRWQEIEESMSKLRSKEKSTTDPIDLSSPVSDLRKETKDRTLLIKIHLQRYLISWEELDWVFARFGTIEYIEVFCFGGDYHSSIRFQDREAAFKAFESLNGRNIYDHCCQLELFLGEEIETEPCNPTDDEPDQERELEGPTDETEFDDSKHAIETIAPIVQDAAETLDGSHQSAFELPRSVRQEHKARLESSMARQGMEIVEEFNKVEQEDDLDKYTEKFEELRIGMLANNPDLPEMYFVAGYIRGLRPEVRLLVEIGRPESLAVALKLSRLHNEGVQAMLRISKIPWRTHDSEPQFVEDEALELTQGGENPGVDRRLIDEGEYGKDLVHNEEEIADSLEVLNQEIKEVPDDLLNQSKSSVQDELKINSMSFNDDDREKLPNQQRTFKVNRKPSKPLIYGGEINWLAELVILLIELMEIRLANSRIESVGSVRNSSAHQVFEKMFEKGICSFAELGCQEIFSGTLVFDPEGILVKTDIVGQSLWLLGQNLDLKFIKNGKNTKWMPFDKGRTCIRVLKLTLLAVPDSDCVESVNCVVLVNLKFIKGCPMSMPFDRGKIEVATVSYMEVDTYKLFVFDPGGIVIACSKVGTIREYTVDLGIGSHHNDPDKPVDSFWFSMSFVSTSIEGKQRLLDEDLIFDPGGGDSQVL